MSRFKPGQSGNLIGRKKGTENLATGKVRGLWQDLMTENIDQLKEDFQTLKPKERIEMAIRMSQFLVPKLQSVEVKSYPEWSLLLMMTDEERTAEILRLKNEISDDEQKTEN